MTTDLLDFPTIDAPPAPPAKADPPKASDSALAVVVPSIKDTVLAQFAATEADLIALATKYRDVAYDCRTTAGMAAARAALKDMRDNGRFTIQRAADRVKADVNDLKRVMGEEVERLVAIGKPVEDGIAAQVKAEVDRAEHERAERQAKVDTEVTKIRGYLAHCERPGMTPERVAAGVAALEGMTFDAAAWGKAISQAKAAQTETAASMRKLHAKMLKDAAAAAEIEAQRIENERVAAENKATAERLAEQQAKLDALVREQAEPPVAPPARPAGKARAADFEPAASPPHAPGTDAACIAQPPAPAAVTLEACQNALSLACNLLDAWVVKAGAKSENVASFAYVASLRDMGGIPRPGSNA